MDNFLFPTTQLKDELYFLLLLSQHDVIQCDQIAPFITVWETF